MMDASLIWQALFWSCAFLGSYAYVAYPALIWCLSRIFGDRKGFVEVTNSSDHSASLPSVALIIAAYNEETVIQQRITNAAAMDYPSDRLRIVIASDGSSDQTNAIVRRCGESRVTLLDYPQRRGKASVLNSAMEAVDAEIVLLSDANTEIDPAAARKLVRWFRDPTIGAVCGRLVLRDASMGRNSDGLYWRYETFLKCCEGRIGGLLGSNGAIYAIRRKLYQPIPANTIVDDFVIPLLARLRTGCRLVYDYEAVAFEETPENVGAEFHRRARIGAGGFQSIGMLWRLLNPRHGWVSFTFLSHKILRWLCPFFMLGCFLASVMLCYQPLYRWLLVGQVVFYLVSLAATLAPRGIRIPKLVRLATMFSSMNAALLAGFVRWGFGLQGGTWRRTSRG
jgi:cellulose synthase/poly-beta-1,6-N-acetylglucosamine synthase-like glycosyltransferase